VNCETYQAELPALIYGELDAEARPAVEGHRRECASCDGLTRELEAVKGALPEVRPPPLLAARLKLAARDELLARGHGVQVEVPPPPPDATLRLASAIVLASCIGIVGFALGVVWSSAPTKKAPEPPRLPLPRTDTDLPTTPDWVLPETEPPRAPPRMPPRAPEAWQRVLFDTAASLKQQNDLRQACEFYERAQGVAPDGPLAAAAMVGRAEALLALGQRDAASALLEEARKAVLGGKLAGGPNLLQRIAELAQEAER
jgi:hypothetical protein